MRKGIFLLNVFPRTFLFALYFLQTSKDIKMACLLITNSSISCHYENVDAKFTANLSTLIAVFSLNSKLTFEWESFCFSKAELCCKLFFHAHPVPVVDRVASNIGQTIFFLISVVRIK